MNVLTYYLFRCSDWLASIGEGDMPQPYSGKALANERNYPNIVELAVAADGLEVELSRRILEFHKSRHIEPRHGRRIPRKGKIYYRWCFSDLATACEFSEQFGGGRRDD
jgi:hypothetical protein